MAGHLGGSLYTPLDKSFPTVVGSYVEEGTPIHLIVDETRLEEGIRGLVRIGLDEIVGYSTPNTLEEYARAGGNFRSTEVIDFGAVRELLAQPEFHVLDVRRRDEYENGHIPGAQNIAHTRLLERKGEVPKEKRVVIHCQSGIRAAVASAILERHGHEVLYVMDSFDKAPKDSLLGSRSSA